MVDATHKSFDASDRSHHAILKREMQRLAIAAQFTEKRRAELDIVVAEITSNFYKHAKGGEVLAGCFREEGLVYIELIGVDQGPGMTDLNRMMADGYSTKNTLGHGLGSIKRLADTFDIFSLKDWGTVLLVRIFRDGKPAAGTPRRHTQIRPVVVAKPKEMHSGDGYYATCSDRYTKIILADGLGHGIEANIATNEAINAFKECPHLSPVEIIRFIHPQVRKTRGLVATMVVIDDHLKQLHIAGVGNISARLVGATHSRSPISYNGIIGHNIPGTMRDQVFDFDAYQQLMLCSDGIRSRWDLNQIAALMRHDLSIQAAAVYKEFGRRTDDMAVLIARFIP
ncbi:TorS-related protein [Parapedobacter pyrenivorans]|uniref:TorS-related protein n=1 Tax=Parapedobacter pyrenivorans TaxID=1305674 RepID=A0A917I324_9SPHI|nr:SpoIIE family protein phosphatase [Parapedobacter pyrenivorans]GGH04282.1 TorS-related protein [Parapedobacter pyrenivorans]